MGLQDVGNRAAAKPLGGLTYDLELANDGVLPVRSGNEHIMTHGDIGLDFFDRV